MLELVECPGSIEDQHGSDGKLQHVFPGFQRHVGEYRDGLRDGPGEVLKSVEM